MDIVNYETLNIMRLGVKTVWIYEYDKNFTSLVNQYKKMIYKENPIIDSATDIALNLTLQHGKNTINFISGPMKEKQLSESLKYKRSLPHDSIVVIIDEFSTSFNSSRKDFLEFISNALAYSEEQSLLSTKLILGE